MWQVGTIVRINGYGLVEVRLENGNRACFGTARLDQYKGESYKKFGLKQGAAVALEQHEKQTVRAILIEEDIKWLKRQLHQR